MGGILSDICFRTEVQTNNENLIRDFQLKALSFPTNGSGKRGQSFGIVSKSILSQDTEWSSSNITSSINESGKEHMHSDCSYCQLDSSSDFLLYHAKQDNKECRAKKSISQLSASFSSLIEFEEAHIYCSGISQQALEQDDTPVIVGNNVSSRDHPSEIPTLERVRSNAIELKPAKAPQGKFVREKQFYVRKSYGDWESVRLESWNAWNATWQVRGADDISFSAAPIALKSKEDYEFLSKWSILGHLVVYQKQHQLNWLNCQIRLTVDYIRYIFVVVGCPKQS